MRTPDDIHDELLVLRCQDGDGEALSELVDRWQPQLARQAMRLTGNSDGADEVVQATWVAIVQGLDRLNDPACFRRWAYRIVTRKCADWVRTRQRQRARSASLTSEPTVRESSDQNPADEISELRGSLKELPEQHRTVLAMFYLENMPLKEIAQALLLPVGTVKSRLHNARKQLKRAMQRREP